jgi:hypothetical protein
MLLALPVLAFLLIFVVVRRHGLPRRDAVLASAVLWGAAVTLMTELLSLPRLLTFEAVAIGWLGVSIAAGACLLLRRRPVSNAGDHAGEAIDRTTLLLLAVAAIIALLVAVVALVAAPSTWDSMITYLPRVMLWISNRSVRFYPTPDYLQLVYAPWAQYAMLHTILLAGSDRFVNMIECLSFLGSAVAVSVIARELGVGLRGQVLAAIASLTIPEGVLEASGPLNTYVVSFWVVATTAFLLRWNRRPDRLDIVCIGLSAGLAILSKGTAYIYLPFIVIAWFLMGSWARRLLVLRHGVAFVLLILLLNAPTYLRNYELSGSPLGLPLPDFPRAEMFMHDLSPRGIAANVVRHLSVHMSLPNATVNAATESALRTGIAAIGVDPDDPKAVWLDSKFRLNSFSGHEILAGNPLHLALLLPSLVLALAAGRSAMRWYALGILGGLLFLCATLLWQPWTSRYHLTGFVLGSVLIGWALERFVPRVAGTAIALLLLAYGLAFATVNRTRALLPIAHLDTVYHARADLYFADQHQSIAPTYIAAADFVRGLQCHDIAIDSFVPEREIGHSPNSFYVYPLLALIDPDGSSRMLRYSGVDNLSRRYEEPRMPPCAVVCIDCATVRDKWQQYREIGGKAAIFGNIAVFSGEGDIANSP